MERGFVLSVVLILAAAMLAGNLGFDDSITGMQGTVIGTGAQSQEESCKQKCERDNDERKKKCMDVFTEKKNKIENKLKGCKNGAKNAWVFCLKEEIPEDTCAYIRDQTIAKCKTNAQKNMAKAETKRNSCYDESDKKFNKCIKACGAKGQDSKNQTGVIGVVK